MDGIVHGQVPVVGFFHAVGLEADVQLGHVDVLGVGERSEHGDLVKAIEETGAKPVKQSQLEQFANVGLVPVFDDDIVAGVGGHYDEAAAGVHRLLVAIVKNPLVEEEVEPVEHLHVGLVDLLEHVHGVGIDREIVGHDGEEAIHADGAAVGGHVHGDHLQA